MEPALRPRDYYLGLFSGADQFKQSNPDDYGVMEGLFIDPDSREEEYAAMANAAWFADNGLDEAGATAIRENYNQNAGRLLSETELFKQIGDKLRFDKNLMTSAAEAAYQDFAPAINEEGVRSRVAPVGMEESFRKFLAGNGEGLGIDPDEARDIWQQIYMSNLGDAAIGSRMIDEIRGLSGMDLKREIESMILSDGPEAAEQHVYTMVRLGELGEIKSNKGILGALGRGGEETHEALLRNLEDPGLQDVIDAISAGDPVWLNPDRAKGDEHSTELERLALRSIASRVWAEPRSELASETQREEILNAARVTMKRNEILSRAMQSRDVIDPIGDSELAQKLYSGVEMIPLSVGTIGASVAAKRPVLLKAGAGAAAAYGPIRSQRFQENLDMGMDPRTALTQSGISATIEAPIEFIQSSLLLGKLPMLGRWAGNLQQKMRLPGRITTAAGANYLEQNFQEALQDLTPIIVRDASHLLGSDVPNVDWGKELSAFMGDRADVAISLIPLSIIGAGGSTFRESLTEIERRDIANAFLSNPQYMTEVGIAKEQAEQVAAIENPSERYVEYVKAYQGRTLESKAEGAKARAERPLSRGEKFMGKSIVGEARREEAAARKGLLDARAIDVATEEERLAHGGNVEMDIMTAESDALADKIRLADTRDQAIKDAEEGLTAANAKLREAEQSELYKLDSKLVEEMGEKGRLVNSRVAADPESFGLVSDFAKQDNAIAAIISSAKKNFTIGRGRPDQVFESQIKNQYELQAHLSRVEMNVAELQRAMKKLLKRVDPKDKNGFKRDTYREMYDIRVSGKGRKGGYNQLPPELRAPAKKLNKHLDDMSQMYIDEGLAEGDLAVTIDENLGIYLYRAYDVFHDPKHAKKVPQIPNSEIDEKLTDPDYQFQDESYALRGNLINFVRKSMPAKGGNESHNSYRSRVRREIDELLFKDRSKGEDFGGLPKSEIKNMDLKNLRKRNTQLPEEIRDAWGEILEFDRAYTESANRMAQALASNRYLSEVEQFGKGTFLFDRENAPEGFDQEIPKGAEYGPLGGLRTTKEMKDILIGSEFKDARNSSGWYRMWMRFNGATKVSKTILSPLTHARNFFANPFFLLGNGHFLFGATGGGMGKGMRELMPSSLLRLIDSKTGKDPEARQEAINQERQWYIELGLLDGLNYGEVQRIIEDMAISDKPMENLVADFARRVSRSTFKGIADVYQAEDAVWKIVGFHAERSRLAKAMPDMADAELDQWAAKIIRLTMPNYSMLPEFIQNLRKFPLIGSFTSFPWEVFRTQINTIKLAVSESRTPGLRRIGAQRFAGLALANGFHVGLGLFLKSMFSITDEEEDAMRKHSAPWDQNATLLPWSRDADGSPRFINISYSDPFDIFKATARAFKGGLDKEGGTPFISAFSEMLEPFISEEVGTSAIIDIMRPIESGLYEEHNKPEEKQKAILQRFWDALKPGVVPQYQRLEDSESPGQDALLMMLGLRMTTIDLERSTYFTLKGFKDKGRYTITNDFTSPAQGYKGYENLSDGEIREIYDRMIDARSIAFNEAASKVDALISLGVDPDDIAANGAEMGMKKATQELLERELPPWKMTKQMQNKIKGENPERYDQLKRVVPEAF